MTSKSFKINVQILWCLYFRPTIVNKNNTRKLGLKCLLSPSLSCSHNRPQSRTVCGPGSVVGISDWLRAGRSGDRIPVEARFFAPVQTGPGAHPASCTMGTGSFPGVKRGRGVTLTPHPRLVPWSWKGRDIPLLPLWAVRPVQSLSAFTRVYFTTFYLLGLCGAKWRSIRYVGLCEIEYFLFCNSLLLEK